jgi:hypothetical protein
MTGFRDIMFGKACYSVKPDKAHKKNIYLSSMRIIDTIPHPQLRISIFSMNDKYLIKFEARQYEQTYKVGHDFTGGLEGIKAMVTNDFLHEVAAVFRLMHQGNVWKEG